MNKQEKIEFITNILEGLKQEAIQKVDRMPEEWDGFELRQYLADKAADFVWPSMKEERGRKRKYKNTCLVKNL